MSRRAGTEPSVRVWPVVAGVIAFVAGFLVLGIASIAIEPDSVQKVSLLAPAGLACSVAAVLPSRWLLLHGVATFGATLLLHMTIAGFAFGPSFASAIGNVAEAWLFAWIVKRLLYGPRRLANRRDVVCLFVASAASAALGAFLMIALSSWSPPLYEV